MSDATRRRGKNRQPTAATLAAERAFRDRLAELGAELLEPGWLGSATKHHVKCRAGHDCYPRPNGLRQGQGPCITCAGQDPAVAAAAFRARLAELGATLLEPEWRGAMRKHHVRCSEGHDCYTKPNWVQQGNGICFTCAGRNPTVAEEDFRARLALLGAELLEPYVRSDHPHHVRCAAGHDCWSRPGDVKQGDGVCRICAGKDPAAAEARFLRTLEGLGATPLYEKWLGSHLRHLVRCANGHDALVEPAAAWRFGTACTICTGKSPVASEAKFLARLAELGATPLYRVWVSSHAPHEVRCPAGHEGFVIPSDVIQGHGACRICAGKIWDVFYVVRSADIVKFGITSGDPRPRLRVHAAQGYREIVRVATGLPGSIAPDTERAVIAALAMAGESPVVGREYFQASCLALILDVADGWISYARRPRVLRLRGVQQEMFVA